MSIEALAAETPVTETPVAAPVETASEPSDDVKSDAPANDEVKAEPEAKPELTELDKYKHATQKRIDRLTAKQNEQERQYQEAMQKLAQYEQTKADAGPKEEDFQTTEEFLKAQGAWEARQEFAKAEAAKSAEQAQKAYEEKIANRSKEVGLQEAEFRKTTPDYDEATAVLNEFVGSVNQKSGQFTVLRDVLMSAPDLPALSYHLGKNPDLLESLMTKEPAQVAWTLIEEAIKLRDAPKKQQTVTAAPPTPVSGQSQTSKPLDAMSYKEIKKAWKL